MPKKDTWNTAPLSISPIIQQLDSLTRLFSNYTDWPSISDYSNIFKSHKIGITPVTQSDSFDSFEDYYEPRVYLKKELQTRSNNWHDFFNAMIWLRFPKTKKILNQLHYFQARKRPLKSNRTKLENKITLFDECGAILLCKNPQLLKLIHQHQWQQLFLNHVQSIQDDLECVIFGHAIYEKALAPYIGLTCHCLIITDEKLLKDTKKGNYARLDKHLAELWETDLPQKNIQFQPFPVLGMPGYWPEQTEDFYQNTDYFRKKPENP